MPHSSLIREASSYSRINAKLHNSVELETLEYSGINEMFSSQHSTKAQGSSQKKAQSFRGRDGR